MSEIKHGQVRRRRTDGERSVAAILAAATTALGRTADARMEEIAAAAGVSRQTVYAHFPSRKALIAAVIEKVTDEVVAALDAAELDKGPAAAAVLRMLDTSWQMFERYPILLDLADSADLPDAAESHEQHEPVFERLTPLIRRGQASGEFDRERPVGWLLAAIVALGHAAGAEVGSGRMAAADALAELRRSALAVLGADVVVK
jgi:AcrR family transcriptional regulator